MWIVQAPTKHDVPLQLKLKTLNVRHDQECFKLGVPFCEGTLYLCHILWMSHACQVTSMVSEAREYMPFLVSESFCCAAFS
jgi:hypothetical protein